MTAELTSWEAWTLEVARRLRFPAYRRLLDRHETRTITYHEPPKVAHTLATPAVMA